jgi:hypothetical protein
MTRVATGCHTKRSRRRSFGSAQWWKRWAGWWCSPANRGGGQRAESRVSRAVASARRRQNGRARLGHALVLKAHEAVGDGKHGGNNRGWKPQQWPQSMCWACGLNAVVRTRGLTGGPQKFNYFPDFPKLLKFINSKRTPSSTPKKFRFCMRLYWSVLNNFLNCSYL